MRFTIRHAATALVITLSAPVFAADTVSIEGAWTRATPPGAVTSATYAQLHNSGAEERTVVAVSTKVADEAQLHTVIDEGGLMKMRQVTSISIPAGGMTELKPGGYHIMMLGIHEPLRDGESVDIEVEFANGDKVTFTSPIQKMTGMKMDHSKMDHSKMKHD